MTRGLVGQLTDSDGPVPIGDDLLEVRAALSYARLHRQDAEIRPALRTHHDTPRVFGACCPGDSGILRLQDLVGHCDK